MNMPITPKEAVKAIYDYLEDLADASGREYFPSFTAEEVQLAEDQNYLITMSRETYDDDLISFGKTKEYKYFKVNTENGAVEWMKNSLT